MQIATSGKPRLLWLTVDDCSPPVANLPSGAAQPLPASLALAIDCTLRLCRPLQRSGHCPLQCHGLPGGGGSPTRAPRPATRGKISDPRPEAPSDPGRPARPCPDICQKPSPPRTFVYSGVTIYIFDTDSRAMFLVKR